ncbi:MAG: T9SS type A sorting domain-containing protein [Bacteroidetes bacterium]|nr:T9SS type A sorting domain-containing protein [Bacteroidota bacterium]
MKTIYALLLSCLMGSAAMAQTVTSITPNHAHSWSTVTVQIVCNGANFISGSSYLVDFVYDVQGSGVMADFYGSQVTVVNSTTLSSVVEVPQDNYGGALSGTYDVVVVGNGGQQYTGTRLFTVTTLPAGIADLNADDMQVYPMPASQQLHVTAGTGQKLAELSLTTMDGKVALHQTADSETEATLQVSGLAAGLYILTTADVSGASRTRKVTIK